MREIKFRAWVKNKEIEMGNEMINVEEIEWDIGNTMMIYVTCHPYEFDVKDIELMQFIGLKDKNGKEIYEGDILKGKGNENFTIEYSEERGMFIASFYGGYFDFNDELGEEQEVIGNKFENPELLK